MLQIKKYFHRFAALSLTGLMLLCSGCGSSGETAPDEPGSSPAITSPAPGKTPASASSPTDINSPGTLPVAPDISIEREAPDSISFLAYKDSFTLTSAEGQTLSYDGKTASGTMELLEQAEMSDAANAEVFYARIPYSDHFTLQFTDSSKDRKFGLDMTEVRRSYFTARGEGKVESVEYDAEGDLVIRTAKGTALDLTVGMPDSSLGERGWIRLLATSAGDEVRLEARGNTLSFSGLDHQAGTPVTADYGGLISGQSKVIELGSDSGTLDLSGIAGGEIAVTAAGN